MGGDIESTLDQIELNIGKLHWVEETFSGHLWSGMMLLGILNVHITKHHKWWSHGNHFFCVW